ncbi:MAG: flavodoxin [Duncaniella sp.]|nr:flavodoxin [Duncaniella sp.]
MKRILATLIAIGVISMSVSARTLIVYYSYTNNVHSIVTELSKQIDADLLRIQPAVKGLDYAANNYAIGSAQISAIRNNPNSASSYPAIDPVNVNLDEYDCIIIGAPLWWSNMAAPLQTFLFQKGKDMAGKHIGLIVSSASSGISSVESDAKRLVPGGKFFSSSLWIRSSQTSNSANLIKEWLKSIDYSSLSGLSDIPYDDSQDIFTVYSISGNLIGQNMASIDALAQGVYIVNGKKIYKNY